MSHATIASPAFINKPALTRRDASLILEAILAALQSLALAALFWLILAAPGLLQDLQSTVPLR